MAELTIYRSAAPLITVNIDDNSILQKSLNGEDNITVNFTLDSFTEILVGDYISWRSKTYTIYQVPEFKKLSEVKYEYSLVFEGEQYALINVLYLLDSEGEFFLTGTASDFIDLIVSNLNRVYGAATYSKGTIPSSDFKNLHFDNENCLQVLQKIGESFSLEYYFNPSKTINFATSIGNATGLSFEYHDGLRNIKRSKVNDKNLITRLYAFGSDRNIDYNYGAKRLKLSTGYISKNTASYGIIEAVKIFDDIYPHFSGTVDTSPSINSVIDTGIDFDLNSYRLEGTAAKIVFLTGDLAGYEFEISTYNHGTNTVTFKSYTGSDGLTLPSATIKPAPGDQFTFVDITMPSAYISDAEAELLAAANSYLNESADPNVIYEIEMDPHNLKAGLVTLDIGDQITITDTQLAPSGVTFRIISLSQSLANQYKYIVKVGHGLLINYFQKIESVQDLIKKDVIVLSDDSNKKTRRALQLTQELQELIYDPDGYFDTNNIRPLSINTGMITVGMKGQQLMLKDIEFNMNPTPYNNTSASWTAGSLIHFTIDSTGVKTWSITSGSITTLVSGTSYYIFAKCAKSTTSGIILITTTQYVTDPNDGYYYFLLGILHAAVSNERAVSLTFGSTSITGRLIRTGKISSQNGLTYFDLDNNVFVMNAGSVGGFAIDTEKLSYNSGSLYLYLCNAEKTSGFFGRGLTLRNSAASYITKDVSLVAFGQIHPYYDGSAAVTPSLPATPEYGLEVIRMYGPGYPQHILRLGGAESYISGWKLDTDAIKSASGESGMSSKITVGDDIRFWAGHATPSSAPFQVTEAGYVVATKLIHRYVLSNDTIVSHDAVATQTATGSWTKKKTITLGNDIMGTITLRFTYAIDVDPGNGASARIYRNGVAVGASHVVLSDTTYTEDIAGWKSGDTAELWMQVVYPNADARCSNFRLLGTFLQDLNEVTGTISTP